MLNKPKSGVKTSKKGLLFVLSAPAGTGKTTLVKMLQKEFLDIVQSVSSTTRGQRLGEVEGQDYFFLSKEQFRNKIADDEFLEYVELYGDFYGTSRTWVEKRLAVGKHVFLVIDTQGALKMMDKVACCLIFVHPPSFDELKRRLVGRKTETEEDIEKRLKWASREIEKAKLYDYNIINDDIEKAYLVLKSIVIAEEHKTEV